MFDKGRDRLRNGGRIKIGLAESQTQVRKLKKVMVWVKGHGVVVIAVELLTFWASQ